MTRLKGMIYNSRSFIRNDALLALHFVFGKIFNLHLTEGAKANVHGYFRHVHTFDFGTLQQFAAEMQACGRGGNCTLMLCEDGLKPFFIFGLHRAIDVFRNGSFTQFVYQGLELIMGTVKQEAQCAASRSRIVDDLGYEFIVFSKIEFVANSDFSCRIDNGVLQ
jgi:hypothetical protein